MSDNENLAGETAKNTDRELWRETPDDYYAPSIHVTTRGGIGMNVGGMVVVLPIREWHKLATDGKAPHATHRAALVKARDAMCACCAREREWNSAQSPDDGKSYMHYSANGVMHFACDASPICAEIERLDKEQV